MRDKQIKGFKKCKTCKIQKPHSEFNTCNSENNYLKSNYKTCERPSISVGENEKHCNMCGKIKDKSKFQYRSHTQDNLSTKCNKCCQDYINGNVDFVELRKQRSKEWYKRNAKSARDNGVWQRLKNEIDITREQYVELLEKADNKCEICGNPDPTYSRLSLDHCHTSKKFRGFLCGKCNHLLGDSNDDIKILQKAIEYLLKFQEKLKSEITDIQSN